MVTPEGREKLADQITIEPLKFEDLYTIKKILEQHIQWPYGSGNVLSYEVALVLGRMKRTIGKEGQAHYFVAKLKEKVAGVMGYTRPAEKLLLETNSNPDQTVEIDNAYVDNLYRSQGVGRKLISYIEEAAQAQGVKRIVLNSGIRYEKSGWGFYPKVGYNQVKIIPDYYGQWPAVIYQKDL